MNNNENNEQTKRSTIIFYFCVAFVALNYWIILDEAFAGIRHNYKNIIGELLLNAVLYWYIWKRIDRKPIYGVIIGVISYLILAFIGDVIAIKFAQ